MADNQQKNGNIVAIITMMFIYGMISFVTNLAAPMGNVWKYQPGIDGSNMWGMMGNMMNFLAYLFMGIPAGRMLTKCGYKKTALIAIATGLAGVSVQFISGKVGICGDCGSFSLVGGKPFSFYIYLLGAFICGFSVCMLNMVVNPMLNLLGGGGNRGNQLNMIGTTFNSFCGTATPILVGALIGEITKATKVADVNLVMYIAMSVFAAALVILSMIPIKDPDPPLPAGRDRHLHVRGHRDRHPRHDEQLARGQGQQPPQDAQGRQGRPPLRDAEGMGWRREDLRDLQGALQGLHRRARCRRQGEEGG